MSVTVDVRTEGGHTSSAGATSLAWNHTVAAGLANGMLVGCGNVASATNTTISTFQWDAAGTPVNLTVLGRVNDSLAVTWASLWGLVNPSSGTKQLKITPAASAQIVGGSASYSGVNQASPWNAASPQTAIGTAGSGTNQPTVNVTSAVGDIAVVMAADNEQANNDLLVMGSGQTVICNDQIGAGQMSSAASDKAGASSVTMSYSGVSSTYTWAIIGGSLNSAPSGGAPYIPVLPYELDIVRNPLARARRNYAAYSSQPVSTAFSITGDVGSLILTGFAPTLSMALTGGLGTATLTGFAPSLTGQAIAGVGQVTLSGFAPNATATLGGGLGQATLTGFAPTLRGAVTAGVGQLTASGFAPSFSAQMTAGVGAAILSGFAPTIVFGAQLSVTAGTGLVVLTGYAPTITLTITTVAGPVEAKWVLLGRQGRRGIGKSR